MATVDVLVTGHVTESGAGSSVHPTVGLVGDPLAWDQAALDRSRARILDIADVGVPGHGPPFRLAARPESAEGAP